MGRSVLIGVICAVLLAAAIGVAGYFFTKDARPAAGVQAGERVVLIFESAAEDGATVPALIAVVVDRQSSPVSSEMTISVPGTSYATLEDAYVFGGGSAVTGALATVKKQDSVGFIVVPASTWAEALDEAGGAKVTLGQDLAVFGGSELITLQKGARTLSSREVGALLRATKYLPASARASIEETLTLQLTQAVAAQAEPATAFKSDLSDEGLGAWWRSR
jgi:hypothetical protein